MINLYLNPFRCNEKIPSSYHFYPVSKLWSITTKLLSELIHWLVLKGTSPVNKFIYISMRIFSYFHNDDLGEYLIDLVAAGKASDYHILSRFLPLTGLTADIYSPHYFIFYQCNCGYTFNT
jgi:hypothetical protein